MNKKIMDKDGYEYHKVLIIGAGIAGVGAADVLSRNSLNDFVILEASERIGGRIWSIDLDTTMGHKVELGANWIHGIDLNPIYVIARDNNLLAEQYMGRHLGKKIIFAQETGDGVHPRLIQEVDIQYGQLMAEAEDFYKLQMPTPLEDDSVGAFVEREFDERMCSKYGAKPGMAQELELRKRILCQRMVVECVIVGADSLHQVALSESGCFEDLPGVHYVIPPGFESVIDILRRSFDSDHIKLKHQVTSVLWDFNESNHSNESPRIKVECLNGKKFSADAALITIPLGCLKKHASRIFDPPLPFCKTNAISRLGMGTVNKVILEFDDQIFPDEVFRLECIWDRSNIENEPMDEKWVKKIASFEAVSDCVIIGWISGKESEYMETLSDEIVGRRCSEVLKNFLHKIKPSFPNLKKVSRSNWKTNVYSMGAYCHIPVGCSAEEIINLGKPVTDKSNQNVLYFAGEATHPTFYSSSHGALIAGRNEAERILQDFTH